MAATISMEELERFCEEKKTQSATDFEDLVYHEMIEILESSVGELWMSNQETTKLIAKRNINAAIRILKYWD